MRIDPKTVASFSIGLDTLRRLDELAHALRTNRSKLVLELVVKAIIEAEEAGVIASGRDMEDVA